MDNLSNMTTVLTKKLKNDIINGVFQPGDRLLPLRELATKYDVSRSVVNSVISSLSAQGFVSVSPRHYVIVNDILRTGSLGILDDVLESQNQPLKLRLLKDVLTYRKSIEIEAIQIIIRNDHLDLSNLSSVVNKQKLWIDNPKNDLDLLVNLDMSFHKYLLESTENVVYKLIFRHFESFSQKMITYFYQNYNLASQNFSLYIETYEAIISHNEKKAINTFCNVLDQGAQYVLQLMK